MLIKEAHPVLRETLLKTRAFLESNELIFAKQPFKQLEISFYQSEKSECNSFKLLILSKQKVKTTQLNRLISVLGDDIEFHYTLKVGKESIQDQFIMKSGQVIAITDVPESFKYGLRNSRENTHPEKLCIRRGTLVMTYVRDQ